MLSINYQFMLCFFLSSLAYSVHSSTEHIIAVGEGGTFTYDPDTIYAEIGDIVTFKFFPTNHSVVRGEYTESNACGSHGCNPCIPYELIYPGGRGFQSGNILTEIASSSENVATFSISVDDASPLWFYCTALQSCHPNGMVGVINPGNGTSVETQSEAAKNAPYQLLPGQSFPAEGDPPYCPTSSGSCSSSSAFSTPMPHSATKLGHVSNGAIAGVTTGAIFIILLSIALFVYLRQKSTQYKEIKKPSAEDTGDPTNSSRANYDLRPRDAALGIQSSTLISSTPIGTYEKLPISPPSPSRHPALGEPPRYDSTGNLVRVAHFKERL